ncbi:HEPN domain protein [bacterium BMS3Abin03]|nr:HEPN domain protein [bacterium BMS3Abin03]
MTSKDDNRLLIEYRLKQAQETILEVEKLINENLLKVAVNRIYYGIYYSLCSLALKYDFRTSKHLQLIGRFNRTFVKEKKVSSRYGKILRKSFRNRTEGDYTPYVEFNEEEVKVMFSEMKRVYRNDWGFN